MKIEYLYEGKPESSERQVKLIIRRSWRYDGVDLVAVYPDADENSPESISILLSLTSTGAIVQRRSSGGLFARDSRGFVVMEEEQ